MRIIEGWGPAVLILALLAICHYVPIPHVQVAGRCGQAAIWVYSGSGASAVPDLSCQQRVPSSP